MTMVFVKIHNMQNKDQKDNSIIQSIIKEKKQYLVNEIWLIKRQWRIGILTNSYSWGNGVMEWNK